MAYLAMDLAMRPSDAATPGRTETPTGRHHLGFSERDTGFEPATFSLGS